MRARAVVLAVAIVLAPLGARAADLVVWWDKASYAQEEEALREVIAAFEQRSGKQVELVLHGQTEFQDKLPAAIEAGRPPDIAFGIAIDTYISEWAAHDRLVDLTETVGAFSNLFDPDALAWYDLLDEKTKQRALYALPVGRDLQPRPRLEEPARARGLHAGQCPEGMGGVLVFLVRPGATRRTPGDWAHDIWGVGLNMSGKFDTNVQVNQFREARTGLTAAGWTQLGHQRRSRQCWKLVSLWSWSSAAAARRRSRRRLPAAARGFRRPGARATSGRACGGRAARGAEPRRRGRSDSPT